jgi:hypothetical protein
VPVDYSVFERFCKVPTWDTSHPLDQKRFYDALSSVVKKKDFSSGQMADYIKQNHSNPIWPKTPEALDARISDLRNRAEVIKEYFSYLG